MKIVFIGNSIVNGFPLKRSECFVSLYREHTGHKVINKGVNGAMSPDILERFQRDVIDHKPDQTFILTGTNDFITGGLAPSQTMENIKAMVILCRENGIEPILMTPLLCDPDMSAQQWIPDVDYNEVNRCLKEMRQIMLDYGSENNIKIADIQPVLGQIITKENITDYLVDGLHPSALGHQKIALYLHEADLSG